MQYAEHIETGRQLKQIRALLMQDNLKQKGKARYRTDKALAYLEKLRSAMDDIVFLECPGKDTKELTKVYYGQKTEA